MKKLGYIKIEDVMELVKLVHRVHMETKHYVSIQFSNHGHDVFVSVMKGEFKEYKPFELFDGFNIYDPSYPEDEAEQYKKIRNYLKELLGETDG